MFDNRKAAARGHIHLSFTLNEKRISYAYIQKNGSSAFKRLLGFPSDIDIGKVSERYPHRTEYDDAVIFVWRDPEERLLSLYRNKIIERQDASDLIAHYNAAMSSPPGPFLDFVRFAMLNADPHCWPQYTSLKPLLYTHAIRLDRLHRTMQQIIGATADEYFAVPTNASEPVAVEMSDEAREMIRRHYAEDYEMIRQLEDQA